MKITDIPGYDPEDSHGFGDCDALESWLDEHSFECIWERGQGNQRAWHHSDGLLVLTMPFWINPANGEFRVIEVKDRKEADYQTLEWWREWWRE